MPSAETVDLSPEYSIYYTGDLASNKENTGKNSDFKEAESHFENIRECKKYLSSFVDLAPNEDFKNVIAG